MFRNASRAQSVIRLRLLVGLPSVALTIGLTGSPALAQPAAPITVVEVESTLNPSPITLTVGRAVDLNVQNAGKADHNLLSDIPVSNVKYVRADNDPADLARYEANNVLDIDAKTGHTSVVTFTPTKAGTFEFHSDEGDDEKLGMTGNFVVVAAGTPAAGAPAPAAQPAPAGGSSVARDTQSLAGQSAATQARFNAVWGGQAGPRWVQEHEAELARSGR
jgi:uncharacterized cupredoxin-like copper-binding protein